MILSAALMVAILLIVLPVGGLILLHLLNSLDSINDDVDGLAMASLKMDRAMVERLRVLETRVTALERKQ